MNDHEKLRDIEEQIREIEALIEQGDSVPGLEKKLEFLKLDRYTLKQRIVGKGAAPSLIGRIKPMPAEWLDTEPPERECLLRWAPDLKTRQGKMPRGVLALGRVGALVAAGGIGKSWALIQLAVAVATGRRWLGCFDTNPGRVLLVLAEEEQDEMQRRIHWAAKLLDVEGEDRKRLLRRLYPLAMAGEVVSLLRNGERTEFFEALRSALEDKADPKDPWRLVVLDPASRFGDADTEKDNAAATGFVEALEALTQVGGRPTVLLAHHTNKTARKMGSTDGADARGVSAFHDGIRWMANLEPAMPKSAKEPSKNHAWLKVTKSNYCFHPDPVLLIRDTEHGSALRPLDKAEDDAFNASGKAELVEVGGAGSVNTDGVF